MEIFPFYRNNNPRFYLVYFYKKSLISGSINLLHFLWTKELQQQHEIPFYGLANLHRQMPQTGFKFFKLIWDMTLLFSSFKELKLSLIMSLKEKLKQLLQNQIWSPNEFFHVSLLFLAQPLCIHLSHLSQQTLSTSYICFTHFKQV